MTFLIIVIIGDLTNILSMILVITSLMFLALYSLNNISSSYDKAIVLSFSSFILFLRDLLLRYFYFLVFLKGLWLVDFRISFSLSNHAILWLGCLLILARVFHIYRFFPLITLLIKIDVVIDIGFGISSIGGSN